MGGALGTIPIRKERRAPKGALSYKGRCNRHLPFWNVVRWAPVGTLPRIKAGALDTSLIRMGCDGRVWAPYYV